MNRVINPLIAAVTAVAVFVYLFPYTWMVMTAFRNPVDTFARPPKFLFELSIEGFRRVLSQTSFTSYLVNSAIITTLSVLFTLLLAVPAAYALAKITKNAKGFLVSILIARMIPGVSLIVPIYLLANTLRQLDTYQTMVLVNVAFNLPFAIWMIRSFFMDVPSSLREAAMMDGATELQVLTKIMFPLVRGGVMATAVFIFIAAWNEFLFALVLTGTKTATAPIAILSFRTAHGIEWDTISAAAFMVSLPVIIFAFVMQKYLVQGLTLGAVK